MLLILHNLPTKEFFDYRSFELWKKLIIIGTAHTLHFQ